MKKLLALILLLAALCVLGKCHAQDLLSPNNNSICYTGSRYVSTITPVGFDINGTTESQSYTPPRKLPPVDDPFLEPIGDVPTIFLIIFVCIYLFWGKKEKGGT